MSQPDVLISGGGLAGLTCAKVLHEGGVSFQILESSGRVGGRVGTDIVDGFRLDHGFQVFLTAYEEAARHLDLKALDLKPFDPGAMVWHDGKFHTLMDPWRRPGSIIEGALAKVGTVGDKLKMGAMRAELQKLDVKDLFASSRPERTIGDALRERGFSEQIIQRFFRPFFGGITFDPDLGASSRFMEFVFRAFSMGDAAVPSKGMEEIPRQLVAKLPDDCILTDYFVSSLDGGVRVLNHATRTPTTIPARMVVNAAPTYGPMELNPTGAPRVRWRSAMTMYFAGDGTPPITSPTLMLNGDAARAGVLNVAIMSNISREYAPGGSYLVAAVIAGTPTEIPQGDPWVDPSEGGTPRLEEHVRGELRRWFGREIVAKWRVLRTYCQLQALPDQSPPWMTQHTWPVRVRPGLYRCGDSCDFASIDGAMRSGRRAAEAVLHDLGK